MPVLGTSFFPDITHMENIDDFEFFPPTIVSSSSISLSQLLSILSQTSLVSIFTSSLLSSQSVPSIIPSGGFLSPNLSLGAVHR